MTTQVTTSETLPLHTDQLRDLWPDHFNIPEVLPPVALLRYQATQLGKKTKHIVEAVVESRAPMDGKGIVYHNFYLIAPLLGDYRYKLFYVAHNLDYTKSELTIANEEDKENCDLATFSDVLSKWLCKAKTLTVIGSLIRQSSALDE